MEPDSVALVVVLLLLAAAGLAGAVHFRPVAIKIVAGLLALTLATFSGVAIVNVYYGYYQSWSELTADLTNSYSHFTGPHTAGKTAAGSGHGQIQQLTLNGSRSGISRAGYVYLPPQYFQRKYAHTRFPVVELLHGSPGTPVNWVLQINIASIMDQLIAKNFVGPLIIVMPSIDSGHTFQECTDAPGAMDDTYISRDVPQDIRAHYRASLIAAEWGIAGYSSGGYCAANLALRHRSAYGAAGIMDGYYRPTDGPAAAALHNNTRLEQQNDPLAAVQQLGRGADPLPAFWISAGTASAKYALGARAFVKALHGIQGVDFTSEPGAGHNFYAWRPAVPRMLSWMWHQIAPPALRVQFPIAGPVNNTILLAPKAPPRSTTPGTRDRHHQHRHPRRAGPSTPTPTTNPPATTPNPQT